MVSAGNFRLAPIKKTKLKKHRQRNILTIIKISQIMKCIMQKAMCMQGFTISSSNISRLHILFLWALNGHNFVVRVYHFLSFLSVPSDDRPAIAEFYSISYLYLGTLGMLTTFILGSATSAIVYCVKRHSPKDLPEKVLFPPLDRRFPRYLSEREKETHQSESKEKNESKKSYL